MAYYRVGDMVCWVEKDEWWLKGCPLILMSAYRIQEVVDHPDVGVFYKIHGWYVQEQCLNILPFFQLERGMRVRISFKLVKERGWENIWVIEMDRYIGHEFTIDDISDIGVRMAEDGVYSWPPSCLEPV